MLMLQKVIIIPIFIPSDPVMMMPGYVLVMCWGMLSHVGGSQIPRMLLQTAAAQQIQVVWSVLVIMGVQWSCRVVLVERDEDDRGYLIYVVVAVVHGMMRQARLFGGC